VSVMINMLILSEGFDCPSLQTVFCRPSGRLCTTQMAGRALRKHASLPFKQIVQCGQTRHPFPRTAAPAEQYLWAEAQGEWRSLKANRQLDAMSRRMQALIAASPAALPKMLQVPAGARRAAGRWSWRGSSEFEQDAEVALL
jgi:hypothetical protein